MEKYFISWVMLIACTDEMYNSFWWTCALSIDILCRDHKPLTDYSDLMKRELNERFQNYPTSFPEPPYKTRILQNNLNILEAGDHIAWHRPYFIWHHAILVEVFEEEKQALVIHWHTEKASSNKTVIKQVNVTLEQPDPFYRINYPEEAKIFDRNTTLDIAISFLGSTNYNLIFENCETFAIYCKTGISESFQVRWYSKRTPIIDVMIAWKRYYYFKLFLKTFLRDWWENLPRIFEFAQNSAFAVDLSICVLVIELYTECYLLSILHVSIMFDRHLDPWENNLRNSAVILAILEVCVLVFDLKDILILGILHKALSTVIRRIFETIFLFCFDVLFYYAALAVYKKIIYIVKKLKRDLIKKKERIESMPQEPTLIMEPDINGNYIIEPLERLRQEHLQVIQPLEPTIHSTNIDRRRQINEQLNVILSQNFCIISLISLCCLLAVFIFVSVFSYAALFLSGFVSYMVEYIFLI